MLIQADLVDGILSLNDEQNPNFQGWVESSLIACERWATIIDNYASKVIPASTTFVLAKQALFTELLNVDTIGENAIQLGLTKYATILGSGMAGFTGVIPPVPIVLTPIFQAGFGGASSVEIANMLAITIDGWFRTGTAINISSGAVVNWN